MQCSRHSARSRDASRHEPAINLRSHATRSSSVMPLGDGISATASSMTGVAVPELGERCRGLLRALERAREDRERPERRELRRDGLGLLAAERVEAGVHRLPETRFGASVTDEVELHHGNPHRSMAPHSGAARFGKIIVGIMSKRKGPEGCTHVTLPPNTRQPSPA